jgi:hypothetical protein
VELKKYRDPPAIVGADTVNAPLIVCVPASVIGIKPTFDLPANVKLWNVFAPVMAHKTMPVLVQLTL